MMFKSIIRGDFAETFFKREAPLGNIFTMTPYFKSEE